ncbi:MAG: T3SS effector HopA1 family protein [Thermomicrobiales bacterium]
MSPGFYTVLSDEPYDAADLVVRVYWNLYSWGAATLVQGITGRLNGAKVPFRLKVVNHPTATTAAMRVCSIY